MHKIQSISEREICVAFSNDIFFGVVNGSVGDVVQSCFTRFRFEFAIHLNKSKKILDFPISICVSYFYLFWIPLTEWVRKWRRRSSRRRHRKLAFRNELQWVTNMLELGVCCYYDQPIAIVLTDFILIYAIIVMHMHICRLRPATPPYHHNDCGNKFIIFICTKHIMQVKWDSLTLIRFGIAVFLCNP